jgi:hypothetical protein
LRALSESRFALHHGTAAICCGVAARTRDRRTDIP